MPKTIALVHATSTIVALAGIRADIAEFDRGEVNAFDSLDAIAETHRGKVGRYPEQARRNRNAA
ncbi:MAG: hypothetical protein ACKO40_07505 [Planctomycetaceae bacterium]